MKLEIVTSQGRTEFVPRADLGIVTVGRQAGSDVSLPDEKKASRKHLTIERTADGWKLIDQMSANGTALNGEKVNYAWLKDGDKIEIGATALIVSGLAPAKTQPHSGPSPVAKPVKLPVKAAEAGEPTLAQERPKIPPAKKLPIGGLLVAAFALFFAVALVYGAVSSGMFDRRAPEKHADDSSVARQAEMAETEKALLAEVNAAAKGSGTTLDRLDALEAVSKKVPNQRASVVSTRVSELRAELLKALELEISKTLTQDLDGVLAMHATGDFAGAISKLDELNAYLNSHAAIKGLSSARGYDKKVSTPRAEIGRENEQFVSKKWRDAESLKNEKRFNESIAALNQLLSSAWLTAQERQLYEGKLAEFKALRDTPDATPSVEKPAKGPSILEGIKKEDRGTLPGRNPLLPKGSESEKELVSELQRKLVRAAVEKKLTSKDFTFKGDPATITGADKNRLFFTVMKSMKGEDGHMEEIPVGRKEGWEKFSPADMLQLYDRVPELSKNDYLAEVIYALDAGLTDDGAMRACKLFKEDASYKAGLDILLATKRHVRVPEGGFVEFEGRLITPDEKETFIFDRRLDGVLERFEKGLGSKDRKKIEDSEKAYAELIQMGERAIAPAIKILDQLRVKEKTKVESTTGLFKDDGKLKALKTELDKRRKYALELVMDEVKYPYPYFTEEGKQALVQAEVDSRVAAVREIWDDPISFTGQTNPDYEAGVERVKAINARMDQLDATEAYHKSTAEEDITYLKFIANEKLNIRNYAGEDSGVKALLPLNAEIMKINEAFPTGEGHCDAEGREQTKITNEYRMMFERRALKINDKLFWAAKHHSRYCVEHNGGQIAHVIEGEPKGAGPGDRMKYEGYSGGGGENIHMNSAGPTALSSHTAWCHSSGHHRNILHPMWKTLGSAKWQNIWTQNFGAADEGEANAESKGGKD